MLLVGLTGGIGSGKSEVARRLAALGAVVVDADVVAREVVEPGTPGLDAVVAAFGPDVLTADGRLDRDRLAALVFGDADARARLNAIVHPLVRERTVALVTQAATADPHAVVVNDVPLLVEAGLAKTGGYDAIVVVAADPATQRRRLVEQRGMAPADADARIAAQAPLADKLAVADYVVRNEGDLAELDAQVREVWAHLAERAGRTMRP
ncbi:MAG: dephospho-CoA kinase [Frankiaceae bacterium]|nr:dephospho-CoA kinase [Frankiaceae bacterium]MBV9370003.1 dephospho-CoA kinase [Frankiales bacterium]